MRAYWRFVLLVRKELWGVLLGIALSFIATFSSVALMGVATWFLSAMAIAGSADVALNIFLPSALIRLLAVSRTLLRYGERYYTHDATFKLLAYLRVFLFERALALKLEDAVRLKSADLQRRMQADLERLEMIYVRQLVPWCSAVLMGLLVGGVLFSYSALMVFTALGLMLAAGVVFPLLATWLTRRASREQGVVAAHLHEALAELIRGFFDLILLGQHEERARHCLQLAQDLAKARATMVLAEQVVQALLLTLAELTLFLLLLEGTPLVLAGQMPSTHMITLAVAAMASFEVLQPLSAAMLNFPYVMHAAERVSDLLHIEESKAQLSASAEHCLRAPLASVTPASANLANAPFATAPITPAPSTPFTFTAPAPVTAAPSTPSSLVATAAETLPVQSVSVPLTSASVTPAAGAVCLELKEVSFAYKLMPSGTLLPVLEHCNLSFSSQCNYVIKAPSGRGKSTLLMLLTRLLVPQQGEIYLNGQAYTQLDESEIRKHFVVALQDITLFSGTIFETFRLVKPQVTRAEIMQALQVVELEELLTVLPQGLDEWLGSTGLALSGGQARRLCLARALVAAQVFASKADTASPADSAATAATAATAACDFLLLDEPSEGLDEAQELRIVERIQQLRKGVVIITHKQAGLRLADQVITL